MTVILTTPRLLLRQLEPGDLDAVAAMLAHPEVGAAYARTFDRPAAEEWLARQLRRYERDGHGLWLAVEAATGEAVGQAGLLLQEVEGARRPELAYLLARPHWGRGFATEAARAVRSLAGSRWGYPTIISLIRPGNLPSRRVVERLGMVPRGEVTFRGLPHLLYEGVTNPGP